MKVLKKKKKIDRPTQNFNFSTGGQTNIFFFLALFKVLCVAISEALSVYKLFLILHYADVDVMCISA